MDYVYEDVNTPSNLWWVFSSKLKDLEFILQNMRYSSFWGQWLNHGITLKLHRINACDNFKRPVQLVAVKSFHLTYHQRHVSCMLSTSTKDQTHRWKQIRIQIWHKMGGQARSTIWNSSVNLALQHDSDHITKPNLTSPCFFGLMKWSFRNF